MSKKIPLALCVMKPADAIDHEATGAKMRQVRANAGITLTEMSARLAMNIAQLSQMETGKRPWDEEKAARYVAAISNKLIPKP